MIDGDIDHHAATAAADAEIITEPTDTTYGGREYSRGFVTLTGLDGEEDGGAGDVCVVRDRLVIEPRVRLTRPLVSLVARHLFAHRHRRLTKRFGVGSINDTD